MTNYNIDTARSYSDQTRLWRALENLGVLNAYPIVVCNTKGRFTAIFGESKLEQIGLAPVCVAQAGFLVIN